MTNLSIREEKFSYEIYGAATNLPDDLGIQRRASILAGKGNTAPGRL